MLASTFMQRGEHMAHKFGNQHPGYTPDSTIAMFERKERERDERGLGWPHCKSFQGEGAKQCATCPHIGKIKSPLHLGLPSGPIASPKNPVNCGGTSGQRPIWADPLDFHEVPIKEAIERINVAGYFVHTLNGDIYRVEPDGGLVAQKREGFNNLFACRKALIADDKSISAGTAWKNSSSRREFASIGYWPDDHGRPEQSYNLWHRWGIEPKQGDCSIIVDHIINVIADGDKEKADFILDWCAHLVQRPWEKPGVALVLRGGKGTGKTLFTRILARIVGHRNTLITASGKKLFAQFNWQLADKLLIGAEEAFFAGNHEMNDQLKHLITGEEIEVEQKYGQRISMKSLHRLIMTSNHHQVISASDDERRFFVCDVSDRHRQDAPYFAPLVRIIKGKDDTTLAAFMHYLRTRDISNWKPEEAARKAANDDLARQKLLSLEPPLQWLLEWTQSEDEEGPSAPTNSVLDTGPPDQLLDEFMAGITASMSEVADTVGGTAEDAACSLQPSEEKLAEIATGPKLASDEPHTHKEWLRSELLGSYRRWAKETRVRGATDFSEPERFWTSMRLLLNNNIFPGRRLFRQAGGKRFVLLPAKQELLDGFNRLLGGKVVDVDDL